MPYLNCSKCEKEVKDKKPAARAGSKKFDVKCDPGGTNFKPDLGGFDDFVKPPSLI